MTAVNIPLHPAELNEDGRKAALMVAEPPIAYGNVTNRKDTFIKEAMLLRQALSLCRSLLTSSQRFEAAYFEAVRNVLSCQNFDFDI